MPDPTTDPPPSRRWLRWTVGSSLLPLGIAAFYLIENYRGEKAWAAEKARLEADGISLDFYSYLPSAADIPDEQNVAEAEPFRSLVPGEGIPALYAVYRPFMRSRRGNFSSGELPTFEGQRPGGSGSALSEDRPTAAQQILDELTSQQGLLDQIRAACARPQVRFEPVVAQGNDVQFSQTGAAMDINNVMRLRCAALLTVNRSAEALTEIKLMIRLAKVASSPSLIGSLMEQTLLSTTTPLVWQGLAESKWSDAELRELERVYGAMNPTAGLLTVHWGEHAHSQARMNAYLADRERVNRELAALFTLADSNSFNLPAEWQESRHRMTAALIPTGWLQQNQVSFTARMRAAAGEIQGFASTPGFFPVTPLTTRKTPAGQERDLFSFLADIMTSTEGLIFDEQRQLMATLAFVRTAIALEQCRRATGSLPDTLAALSPPPPVDPITGQPLRYELQPDGNRFKLWSVALNGTDEGGNSEKSSRSSPDWVWRSWISPPEPPAAKGSARELVLPPPPMAAPGALPR